MVSEIASETMAPAQEKRQGAGEVDGRQREVGHLAAAAEQERQRREDDGAIRQRQPPSLANSEPRQETTT